ncbi:MAG: hypothetical protein AAB691_01735 [Patescibacteria group bacterium]
MKTTGVGVGIRVGTHIHTSGRDKAAFTHPRDQSGFNGSTTKQFRVFISGFTNLYTARAQADGAHPGESWTRQQLSGVGVGVTLGINVSVAAKVGVPLIVFVGTTVGVNTIGVGVLVLGTVDGVEDGIEVAVKTGENVGVEVPVGGTTVSVAVHALVGTGVDVKLGVFVDTKVGVGIGVSVSTSVAEGVTVLVDIGVAVKLHVRVGIRVGIAVSVAVGEKDDEGVAVAVEAGAVGVSVGTIVAVGVTVEVGRKYVAVATGVGVLGFRASTITLSKPEGFAGQYEKLLKNKEVPRTSILCAPKENRACLP